MVNSPCYQYAWMYAAAACHRPEMRTSYWLLNGWNCTRGSLLTFCVPGSRCRSSQPSSSGGGSQTQAQGMWRSAVSFLLRQIGNSFQSRLLFPLQGPSSWTSDVQAASPSLQYSPTLKLSSSVRVARLFCVSQQAGKPDSQRDARFEESRQMRLSFSPHSFYFRYFPRKLEDGALLLPHTLP